MRLKKAAATVLILIAIGAGAAGVYLADRLYFAPLREQQILISNLKLLVRQLTKDVRIAEVFVIRQETDPLATTFRFVEVDETGKPVAPEKTFTISGDVAYFDTLVIKFEDSYTPVSDLPLDKKILQSYLNNRAIIFFRRVFGERQNPADGFPLDDPGTPPAGYSPKRKLNAFERRLWDEFWDLATDPDLAREHGVRAAHGQAVYTRLRHGVYYVLERRLTGDLTIRPVALPAVVK